MFKKTLTFIWRTLITSALVGIAVGVICAAAFVSYAASSDEMNIDGFCALAKAQDRTTKLCYTDKNSSDGKLYELADQALFSEQNREWVKYENIPKDMINAFVAIEDHRFWEHGGIDLKRTAGAIVGFVSGKTSYGGSTIDQQLIKNITGENDHSVSRKVSEIVKAYKLDRALSKEEILELYLNTIYLAQNSYGIGAASRTYFSKDPCELTLAECATLACIPQSPTKWNPIRHPENNKSRRITVLDRMLSLEMISESEYETAVNDDVKITLDRTRKSENSQNIYSWYTESVIDECIELLISHGLAQNTQTAKKLLYTGGLTVVTAQDPKMQSAIEKYFSNEANFYMPDLLIHPECSMVVMNPKNGNILALAGATGTKNANRTLNYATATKRSPGSSIKPISVYAPAIDMGYINYGSVIDDTPCKFVSDGRGGMRGWPRNYPTGYRGLTTVRDAVARSVNTVAVKVLHQITPEYSFDLLQNTFGISSLVSFSDRNGSTYTDIADSPLALGQLTRGVSVKEMTSPYTALANGGVFNKGKTVLKILSGDGTILIDNQTKGTKVFSEQTATIMTKLLMGVTGSGTASKMELKNKIDCAGKTGTTTSDCDRWFIGYTPELLAGVWFGYATPKSLDGYPHLPSPALKTFDNVIGMLSTKEYLGHTPSKHFKDAEGVVSAKYCRDSGKLVSSACMCDPRGSRVETGYFTKETVPHEYCDTHTLVLYDNVKGGVACPHCKRENCRYVGLLKVNRAFAYDTVIQDAQYTCISSTSIFPCLDSSKPYFYNVLGFSGGRSAVSLPYNRYCSECYLENGYEDDITNSEDTAL